MIRLWSDFTASHRIIHPTLLMIILATFMGLTSLSTDIYLPAMPVMQRELQGDVELTVTGFLVGFAIGQLIWGVISDRIGRKIPLLIGMLLFVIGSIGCALATSIENMVFWRVFQALGACTAPMLARSMVRDLYDKTEAVKMLSTLVMIMAIAPIIGPLLGGQIIVFSTWHSIFWLLAGVGVLLLASLWLLPETHHPENRAKGSLWQTFGNYRLLLANKTFMQYTLCVTLYYVAAFAFVVGSPKVYIEYFGVKPQHYGWLFALNVVGLMAVSFVNKQLAERFSINFMLKVATLIASVAGWILITLHLLHTEMLVLTVLAIFVFFSMNGIIASCATAGALDGVPEMAGSGSALIGALQYGSGIVSTLLLTLSHDNTPWTMSWIIGLFTGLSMLVIFVKSSS